MNQFNQKDADLMRHAIRIARRGAGFVLPNPLVGAVIAKDGELIGEGFHEKFGCAHAEFNALQQAGAAARNATLYVTLEPCAHHGKTPPCVDAILAANIRRVVIAMQDPNPLVAGKGIAQLRAAGVQVDVGLLEAEAVALNKPFIKYISSRLPYVTLKLAQTLDGRIADKNGGSKWISSPGARKLVHQWRFEAGAVLVGIGTVLADDPRLTVRHVAGPQPFRIVLDRDLRIPLSCHLLSDAHVVKTIIVASENQIVSAKEKQITDRGARVLHLPLRNGYFIMPQMLSALAEMGIAHVFVEGGAAVFSAFFEANAVDHVCLFIAPKLFGQGRAALDFNGFDAAKPLQFQNAQWRAVDADMLFEGELSS